MRKLGPLGRRRGSPSEAVDEFIGLFWRHGPAVHSYLSRRAGNQAADDLLEEVWVRAFRSRDRYDDQLPAPAWLYGIARNVLLGHFRSRRPTVAGDIDRSSPGESDGWDAVDERLDARRTVSGLTDALAALSAEDREVLLLVAWEQLTPAEAAVVLKIPPGTARSRLHRARLQLRASLDISASPPGTHTNNSFQSPNSFQSQGKSALEVCDD
jgi:RNA polymerase sigma-70 factor (ECF subfamily)